MTEYDQERFSALAEELDRAKEENALLKAEIQDLREQLWLSRQLVQAEREARLL